MATKPYYMSSANIRRSQAMGDLSDAQVMDIRWCRANGQKVKDIAADYAISAQCVSQICNGRTYKHLPLVTISSRAA